MPRPTAPTAQTFFPTSSHKTNIQTLLTAIDAGADRNRVLSEVTRIGAQMGGDDRNNLVNMVYSQLALR